MSDGGRAKERIDSGPVSVLPSALGDQDRVFLEQQVIVGSRDVDPAWLETLPIPGQPGNKRLVPAEPTQQRFPGILRRHVLDDEYRRTQVGGQLADQLVERFQSSRRRSD